MKREKEVYWQQGAQQECSGGSEQLVKHVVSNNNEITATEAKTTFKLQQHAVESETELQKPTVIWKHVHSDEDRKDGAKHKNGIKVAKKSKIRSTRDKQNNTTQYRQPLTESKLRTSDMTTICGIRAFIGRGHERSTLRTQQRGGKAVKLHNQKISATTKNWSQQQKTGAYAWRLVHSKHTNNHKARYG